MPLRRGSLILGLAVLAATWLGPLPRLAGGSFAAHMTMHIAVVAVAAPLLALGMAGTGVDPVRAMPRLLSPIPASMIELVVVWAWHAPALHHAARHETGAFILEQASFVMAGLLLWIAAVGGNGEQRRVRAGSGVVALLFTSMHMTLLGALFALGNRPLFHDTPSALDDQQLGGVIMLLVGGASYLVGGLGLTALALRAGHSPKARRPTSAEGPAGKPACAEAPADKQGSAA
jgi:putative membrane protein